MSPQRYEPINADDDEDHYSSATPTSPQQVPSSPPPSFRSRTSSPSSRRLVAQDPHASEANQTLAETFDDGEASDAEDGGDDRQRVMRADPETASQATLLSAINPQNPRSQVQRRITELPSFLPSVTTGAPRAANRPTNDGVFANLAAKPERGETLDEKPPTYEQAAADATPPYWETTIVAPGMASDEVYVDGLPVGSVFSFVWNGMISMSFQLVGFLLTYLLHTTHAAKNGSRAGLGLTLVQYGFYMKGSSSNKDGGGDPGAFANTPPPNPNSHSFDPDAIAGTVAAAGAAAATSADSAGSGLSSVAGSDWVSYILMIVGWFILIRAVSDFLRARRHEQLVLQSPDRGLPTPIIADGEQAGTVV